ncbi:MAG: glycosyltransferase family 2 protein [Deltaproteobacteria bacterium]|nr:glycosyltransferase family 2 protein [Deltaproteobacteria bacterium]
MNKLVVVIPAHNEENHLPKCLDSILAQTVKPDQVIIVDDRSTDKTLSLAKTYEQRHPNFFKVIHKPFSRYPNSWILRGEHIGEAFNEGVKNLPGNWEFLAKIDADMVLEPSFFERIIEAMKKDETIGICSGVILKEKKLRVSAVGGCRVYRRGCWDQSTTEFNFLAPELNAWDSYLEMKARTLGWKCMALQESHASVQRSTGNGSTSGRLKASIRMGVSSRRLGYTWYYFLLRVVRNLRAKPYLLKSLFMLYGWIWSWWKKEEVFDEGVAMYVKRYQKRRLVEKVKFW